MITEEAANEHEPPSLAPDRPGYHLAVVVVFLLLLCVSWPWRIFEVTTEPVGNGRMAASLVAFPLAGFQVIMHGRIGVFTEDVINLPSPAHGNRLAAGTVNGWEISGITQFQSGPPLQPNRGGTLNVTWPTGISNQSVLGTDSQVLVPSLTCDPRTGLKSGQYFNPNCFAIPAQGTNGSIIWPYIKGPAYFNSDLSIYKNFKLNEKQKVQFRFSAFNFLNHALPQFGLSNDLNLVLGSGGTNTNTLTNGSPAYTVGRRVVELALKYNF